MQIHSMDLSEMTPDPSLSAKRNVTGYFTGWKGSILSMYIGKENLEDVQ